MALSILDGTQTATTLSTILSSGQHITAHTVVSLGTQAITDMRGAVSGSVVSISNFPATQPISGSVTIGNSVTIGSLPAISGTVTANVPYVSNQPQNQNQAIPVVLITDEGKSVFDTNQSILASINGALPAGTNLIGSVTASISGTVPISISSVTIGSALPAGTNRIGVVTVGGGTVTIGAGTAQIGSVTAFGSRVNYATGIAIPIGLQGDTGFGYGYNDNPFIPIRIISNQTGTAIDLVGNETGGNLPISGTVTASLAISSTTITKGSFTSLTSATLVPANTARKMATVYNLGAGQLFVNAGATATTLGGGFMVALSSGDYFECPFTTTTLSALFATAGTASWVSH